MTIHKEGYGIIAVFFIILGALDALLYFILGPGTILNILLFVTLAFFGLVVSFFRVPKRIPVTGDDLIIAPADGKVVVIEETEELEYFKDKRLQVSIFMSPLNVHINWYPVQGLIKYFRHHSGLFLKAWLPKSSTENERTTVVIEKDENTTILMRQIAGAVARRIVAYAKEGEKVNQCQQEGFIKFGSRIDLYLPLGTQIDVDLNQKVTGSQTIIGRLK
ncbi:phosphatidylserine decarboxylase family protein [Marinifilum sp. N1E240]|jgi:phosphatidylserine decarboxylase|uniref:phosphatidylserine decarboxylase family protein n=1 Tax=Marinifilum sp. N1E240 TaxID=2608082 RepID=UPI00128CAF19|nr:phosphatidylserine decarboxylase family protein [Marinifilum sp. N1E240]MPQ45736.1 phosphatidylserine decarboxylase family protein [Marinifilum sp. N1E240]